MIKDKKLSIMLLLLLSFLMISAVSGANDTENLVKSDLTHNELSHTNTDNGVVEKTDTQTTTDTDTLNKNEETPQKSLSTSKINNKEDKLSTNLNEDILTSTDNGTFTALNNKINSGSEEITLENDYIYTETDTQYQQGILINDGKTITIHGNNHTINGQYQARIFQVNNANLILENLKLIQGQGQNEKIDQTTTQNIGGAIFANNSATVTIINCTINNNKATGEYGIGGAVYALKSQLNINNTILKNNTAELHSGAIYASNGYFICNNSKFIDNYAEKGSSLILNNVTTNIYNTFITSCATNKHSQIYALYSKINLNNITFVNISSSYAPALLLILCENSIINSKFINLTANISAGAIAIKNGENTYIKACEFINTKSLKNAGAIHIDYNVKNYNATILDCVFNNASSSFGGAYIQLGGNLFINNSNFTGNKASYDGGAIYIAFTNSTIDNCNFNYNSVELLDDYPTYGGAIYSDYSNLTINNSKFNNNSAYKGNAIYACDSKYNISNSDFTNNTNAIFTHFDKYPCNLNNNTYNNDSVITNKTYSYQTAIDSPALQLELINNTINVTSPPSRFDLRDYGLVTPIKNQGIMGACWTFGMMSALESAILKAYGIEFDLSEDNLFHNMLKYFPYGHTLYYEGGLPTLAVSYLLRWFGPTLEEIDNYDEVGKLSPAIINNYDVVHIQDAIFVPNDDIPNGTKIKTAILNYGVLSVNYHAEKDDSDNHYNPKTFAHYNNESLESNHEVSVIGWDDNFSKDNFLITPPGDGAWIIRNSWGTDFGDNGYLYISYYDKTFVVSSKITDYAVGIIIENTIPYNKNYQYDYTWSTEFYNITDNISYANVFEAVDDDLIAAVGTYFNSSDVNYSLEIYVNDQLKLIQDGTSPFCGYHTIKLDKYIPIKKGDIFKAIITSNAMPYINCSYSRVHYTGNKSYYNNGYEWVDLYDDMDIFACLKVYTVDDDAEKFKTDFTINTISDYLEGNINIELTVTERNNYTGQINVTIGSETYIVTLTNGSCQTSITPTLSPGIYNAIIDYPGNDLFYATKAYSNKFLVYTNTSFAALNNIIQTNTNINLEHDYTYDNRTDTNFKTGILINKPLTINGNEHTINGNNQARIFDIQNSNLTLINLTITNGQMYDEKTNKIIYNMGGAIFAEDSQINITNCTFNNNTAHYDGGAIYTSNSQINITNTTFNNNTAYSTGGAIYAYDNSQINITNTTLKNNNANNGGAIYIWNSEINITNTTINNNTAYSAGGAIYIWNSEINITNTTINNNTATWSGAICSWNSEINITNTQINTNTAYIDSGAIEVHYTQININNTTINNNTAYSTGGAIYTANSQINITNTQINTNTAYSAGGAIYIWNSEINITNTQINTNTAEVGGAIYNEGTLTVTNSTINNNTAEVGGAIYANKNSNLTITDSVLRNNMAHTGGAIYSNGTLNISKSLFMDDQANNGTEIFTNTTLIMNDNIIINAKTQESIQGTIIGENNKIYDNPITLLKTINEKEEQIQNLNHRLTKTQETLNNTTNDINTLTQTIKDQNNTIKTLTDLTNNLQNTITKLNKQISKTGTKKLTTKIIAKTKTYKTKNKVKKYTVTLKSGNKIITKAKITLKIKGKTYKATTNKQGKAIFKINNLNKKGKYTAKINYKGNKNYNKCTKIVKLIIKE